jgi:putative FmdB family regulatory protein
MPTYGYRCSNCGHEFEIRQKMTDEPLKSCPKCQGKLSKILYPVGISFKGSGFYTTDYKDAGKSAEAASSNGSVKSSEGSSEASSGSKSESKSGTKPETKSEAKSESKSDSKTEKKTS